MVTDLHYLNAKTAHDCYVFSHFDGILPYLARSKYFGKMNIWIGYYDIEVEEHDEENTVFGTRFSGGMNKAQVSEYKYQCSNFLTFL